MKQYAETIVLFCAGVLAVAASQAQNQDVTVLVYDSAGVGAAAVDHVGREVARIYRAAGIRLAWINCSDAKAPDKSACRVTLARNQAVLHIVHNGKTSSDTIFGVAFIGPDGWGKYADVFFDRIRQQHDADTAELLGAVAAHELGHLLLGSHSHTWVGIMRPIWQPQTLRQVNTGHLFFTQQQAETMKARISREEVRLAGTEPEGP